MLPVILVAVGAYLIGDSVLGDGKKYAKGGQTKEKLAEYLVTLTDEDGFEDDVVVMAKSEDDALYQAEKIKGYESSENGVVMLTDFDGNKIEYAKGGELMSDDGDIPYNAIKKMQKIKINELNKWMPSHKYLWYDNNSKKFYFKDHLGRIMELKNGGTLGELDRFIKKNNISLKDGKMAHGGKTQGYDDKEDERLAMEHGKMSKKDDARFEERGKMAKGGATSKEYLFNFVDGGWNSIVAKDKKEAVKLAKEKYKDLKVDEKSFRVKTEKDYKQLMSSFYAKGGKLVGKQKNLDLNKNGKLDAEDFKMLRKGKK